MIPSVLSSQVQRGIEDFLKTTFPISNPFFEGIVDRLIDSRDDLFKGPYLSMKLPFRLGSAETEFFQDIPLGFTPYLHQETAFRRLSGEETKSTLVATGTGSGKTECFLYPVLDYCYRHRGEPGIKAIIIYPMNALATDQAKRLAKLIHGNENLRDKIRAGLFIGQMEENAATAMTADRVITNKDTLRLNPPDILLTNYKMLDYLLIRPRDFSLWQANGPETLKYLVVDELHTFDGAQGTDLACLIRRLKERLKTPEKYLCCVGTSATLGGKESARDLQDYSGEVFGEEFDADSVIAESLLTPGEFFQDSFITRIAVVPQEEAERLRPDSFSDFASYIQTQHELWLGERIENPTEEQWKIDLSEKLKQHAFFRNLLMILEKRNGIVPLPEIIQELDRVIPEFQGGTQEYKQDVLGSLLALISCARVKPAERLLPFLNVRLQLWARELRRIVAEVGPEPRLRFSDDLNDEQSRTHLPVVHCRECGAMGWAGTKREQDTSMNPDLQHFYLSFFHYSPTLTYLFPKDRRVVQLGQQEFGKWICGHCLHLTQGDHIAACPVCGKKDRIVPVLIVNTRIKKNETVRGTHNCPFCDSFDSLTIIGSRAASLTSVAISQIYSSTFNDDKKLLTFSDSVQDASHRAAFFAARTYRFNFRSALQKFIDQEPGELSLDQIPAGFAEYWLKERGKNNFISTFLAPDMAWFEDYELLVKNGKIPDGSTLLDEVLRRIDWEITSEYGFNCRIGRTLEKTGSSIGSIKVEKLKEVSDSLLEPLQNELGCLRELDERTLLRFLLGFITQLRAKGGVFHPALKSYVDNWGGYYSINIIPYMPNFGKHSRTPAFLTTKGGTRFDTLISRGRGKTWYEDWVAKNFCHLYPLVGMYSERIYELALRALSKLEILEEVKIQGHAVWGISRSAVFVGREVKQYRCDTCGHSVSATADASEWWRGCSCLKFECRGHYEEEPYTEDYYGKLYSTGDVQRIFAEEHTGLLERGTRELLERRFISGENPWDPNLLSCTPTLEMGIDIGDLSSVILCSVPPSQSNYLQRIGRAGRRDGNSFAMTVANARPHDLYFYDQPEEMIAGRVEPPGCFLNAPAVLERQFTAFCFDRWIETGASGVALPYKLGQVLTNLSKKDNKNLFPFNLLDFIENNRTVLFERFVQIFQGSLTGESVENLRAFVEGAEGEQNLRYRILNGLNEIDKEKRTLQDRVKKLNYRIKQKENDPVKDKNYESDLDDLRLEKTAINGIIRSIVEKDTFNFFTDEGLLPNYAFPQAGVILRSVIYRRKKNTDGPGKYQTKVFEYERPAVSAIHELAPANRFYAEGRKVTVDQINMATSEVEDWRFCNNCTYHELVVSGEEKAACPKCGSPLWADDGQKRRMIRMRQVIATTSDKESRNQDDSDDREPEFYNKHMLFDADEKFIEKAFKIDREDFPFGFEYLNRATFREVNFGNKETVGENIDVAGHQVPKKGFAICRECGKVQRNGKKIEHAVTCKYKLRSSEKNVFDCLYMYREFTSEAIRILLPMTSFAGSDQKLHSFIAALFLGLKKVFRGNIDHLQTTVYDDPVAGTSHKRKYLVLYDVVPGGTGYLKQLIRTEKPLMNVFEAALEVLRSCSCQQNPEKDGCYRCLFAYRMSFDMADISRNTAIQVLTEILKGKDALVETESLSKISVNALFDSELEARFVEAVRRVKFHDEPVSFKQDIVNGKPGWYLKINGNGYYIEPQVSVGPESGVLIPSKIDFVFHPERQKDSRPSIAVFTDGFSFHADGAALKNRIGKDLAQRMALVRSGKYLVFSLSWNDIENQFKPQQAYFINFTQPHGSRFGKLLDAFDATFGVKKLSDMHLATGFEMLIQFLAIPDFEMWRLYSLIHAMIHIDSKKLGTFNAIESAREALKRDAPWHEIQPTLEHDPNGTYCFGINEKTYEDNKPMLKMLVCIGKEDMQGRRFQKLEVTCRFYDDDDIALNPNFKVAWNGFIRLYNVYQFAPQALFVTSKGILDGEYSSFFASQEELRPEAVAGFEQDGLRDLKSVTDQRIHPFLSVVAANGIALPEAGFELSDDRGAVIASAELGWPTLKVAFLVDEEMERALLFTERGWKVAHLAEVVLEPEKYLQLLQ
ncbi:DEAD/DEAH box helicase [Desulforhabdus amnigena]|jgi:DEAD/DEAH box helicase domain-containing protein|uniref:DEAD/DEAH box helicase n=1 Tax=Desulforhabdus amnigena TaxID=40218 RepID=A0A9W6FUN2_9BACT|nr:DEAD/DEAH box helicase [Desulforhabdus amnigena]NLJ28936.1 DEAD/DEAH box helicase [Deltaproteobacteria bacterium]GLI35199.1 DEAD/DEAH box helicase [Desulforhabdus amnigena]